MATREFNFIVGPETSEQPGVGTPSADTDLVTKGYADIHYMQGRLSCADVTAIKAIGTSSRTNGDIVLDRTSWRLYYFNSASSASGDDVTVLTPSSGTGRWLRIGSPNTTAGDITVYGASGDERMPVGTDGYAIVADSTQSRKVKYAPIAGAGEINACTSPSDATNWVASGAGVTIETSTTAADLPLEGIIPTCLKITGVSGSDYARFRFTMPDALLGRKLKMEWFQLPAGSYAAGDFKIDLYYNAQSNYGGAYTRVALSTDSSAVSSIPNLAGKYTTTFDDVPTNLYYEVRIVRTSGTGVLNLSNIVIGPGVQPQGAVVGVAETVTVTTSASNASVVASRTRIGQWAKFVIKTTFSGASSGTITFTLPSGNTIDTSVSGIASGAVLGTVKWDDNGVGDFAGVVKYTSTTTIGVSIDDQSGAYDSGPTFASGDILGLEFLVPIAEWAGSGTVNLAQNDVEYVSNSSSDDAENTTSFAYGPSGSTGVIATTALTAARAKRVQFQSPIQAFDTIILEYQPGGGTNPWIELTGIDTGADLGNYHVQNGTSYGIKIVRVSGSTTQLDVIFGKYAWPNSTYGAAGVAWTSSLASTRWRVKKFSGGQAVGFGNVAQNMSGLVKSAGQLLGTNTNDSAADGYVGETVTISRLRSNPLSLSTATAANVCTTTSFTLQPGDYDIGAIVIFQSPNTTVVNEISACISTTSATSSGADTIGVPTSGECRIIDANPYTSSGTTHCPIIIPQYPVSVAAGTTKTLYLVAECTFSVSTLTCYGSMYVRRVR